MVLYGTAILAGCYVIGIFLGEELGYWIGAKANVGGVGIAMLLLIVVKMYMEEKKMMPKAMESGITFWGAMYIPVVVAMAASQNVVVALKGGWVAVLGALLTYLACGGFIALLSRTGNVGTPLPPVEAEEVAARKA